MAGFVDLKRRPTDPEDKSFYQDPEDREYYPLQLYLDKVEMDHLGIGSYKLGDEFILALKVRVTSRSENESEMGSSKSMSLSALAGVAGDMPKASTSAEQADALFPTMRKK